MNRTNNTWLIRAISNLHPGSGDADFGVIDKHVQRDPVTQLPIIFASSIKGALRELFETNEALKGSVKKIFGSDAGNNTHQQGSYRFYDAHLLALPVRSDHHFYYLATCPDLISDFVQYLETYADSAAEELKKVVTILDESTIALNKPKYLGENHETISLEEYEGTHLEVENGVLNTINKYFGTNRIALFHATDFQRIAKELPTVARNYLNNGVSKNLWYEEIIPRESRFYCSISTIDGDLALANGLKDSTIENLVQIGGNATVGYGLCEMKKLSTDEKKN